MSYLFTFETFWQTPKYIPFLERELRVMVISEKNDQAPTARQIQVIDSINQISPAILASIQLQAQAYYQRIAGSTDLAEDGITIDALNLAQHYSITEIIIPRLGDCPIDYIFFVGECDWEPEHGMEILCQNGVPIQCNAQEGLYLNETWEQFIPQHNSRSF